MTSFPMMFGMIGPNPMIGMVRREQERHAEEVAALEKRRKDREGGADDMTLPLAVVAGYVAFSEAPSDVGTSSPSSSDYSGGGGDSGGGGSTGSWD